MEKKRSPGKGERDNALAAIRDRVKTSRKELVKMIITSEITEAYIA